MANIEKLRFDEIKAEGEPEILLGKKGFVPTPTFECLRRDGFATVADAIGKT